MKIRSLTVAAIITAAAMIAFAPSAANAEEEQPPVTGCVWSGSGWIGAGEVCPTDPPPNELESTPEPEPTVGPTEAPAEEHAVVPSEEPSQEPTEEPAVEPSEEPSPEPSADPTEPTEPAPIVVDTAPRVPIFTDLCGTANDTWTDPGNTPDAPWQYFATDPVITPDGEVIDPGYVYAMLPDTHATPSGHRIWEPVWELLHVFTDEPCPIVDDTPAAAPVDEPGVTELAETGADTPSLILAAFAAAATIGLGAVMIRRRVHN